MSANTRYLTKSRFKLALSCPTKLYYTGKPHFTNTLATNDFMAMLADGGFQVGELAKLRHPGGHEITSKRNDEALRETAEWMKQDKVTLFEAAFAASGCLVRVDVLVKNGNAIELIEVKAKSFDSTNPTWTNQSGKISSEMRPYLQDVAFQKWVVQQAHPQHTVTTALMLPDKSKPSRVNGLNTLFKVVRNGASATVDVHPDAPVLAQSEELLAKVGVDHLVADILGHEMAFPGGKALLPELAASWSEAYRNDVKVPPTIGQQCTGCEFKDSLAASDRSGFHDCWKAANAWTNEDFVQGTVLDVWNFRKKQLMIDSGIRKLPNVPIDALGTTGDASASGLSNSDRQRMQIEGLAPEFKEVGYFLDHEGLRADMSAWRYPFHFIDFETAAVALPFHQGRRPFEQVAFQFSHHTMAADGTVHHRTQFLLAEPGVFPNYAFARALKDALGNDQGTIFRWSAHENTILKAIQSQLEADETPPDDAASLIEFIAQITDQAGRTMIDLADVARRRYFHPKTSGSSSIKKVLPAVMSYSRFLASNYSEPRYGSPEGIPSHNFQRMNWWRQINGVVQDPYQLLGESHGQAKEQWGEMNTINQGGAASEAYLRLQFESLSPDVREQLKTGLLRYCELDTLAMVMILQAWLHG